MICFIRSGFFSLCPWLIHVCGVFSQDMRCTWAFFRRSISLWLVLLSTKVVCVGSFSQTLRRYTSLNHLAQAARAVLQNSAQINQMLSDLNRVDFTNVQVSVASLSSPFIL